MDRPLLIEGKQWITGNDAARRLGVSHQYAYKLSIDEQWTTLALGPRFRIYLLSDVLAHVARPRGNPKLQ